VSGFDYDVLVIGAGSGGMVAAEVAPRMGVRCAIVERARIGGDCLWTGCVPSKALIASARAAHIMRHAGRLGLAPVDPEIDTSLVYARMRGVQEQIAESDDNAERMRRNGADVIEGHARLVDGHTVEIDGRRVTSKFILLATGSRPAIPPIEGLEETGYLTSENLFEQERAPESMLIVGGGPIAVEMAQAHRRLGVDVTILESGERLLPRDEPTLVAMLTSRLREEGVAIELGVDIRHATTNGTAKELRGSVGSDQRTWHATEVLIAAGRKPNIEELRLREAGVELCERGVIVDGQLRSSVPSVYACGDVVGRYLFTHSAGREAVVALRNMFYPGSGEAPSLVPWSTFTDPELAHVGMTGHEAAAEFGDENVRIFRWDLAHNDRARTEAEPAGAIVVVTSRKFHIVGAHVLAPAAGEIIGGFTGAIARKERLTPDLANLVHVYPTISTSISQLAAEATSGQLERPFLRAVRFLYERIRRTP
jgi:pyruvate/2-oxoglutarate dehydrogenase complex dihydrolipoamide dehydrogenase (E3) component